MSYTIEAKSPMQYAVEVISTGRIFTNQEILNVEIERELMQICTASFDILAFCVPDAVQIDQGVIVRIYYNGYERFAGTVTKVKKDENTHIWTCTCEDGAALLRDASVEAVVQYKDCPRGNIILWMLPISAGDSGSANNPPISRKWLGTIVPGDITSYKTEIGEVLSGITKLVTNGGLEWQVRFDNSKKHFVFDMLPQVGVSDPAQMGTWKINKNLYNTQRQADKTKVINVAVAPGSTSSTNDTVTVCALNSTATTLSMCSEPYLTANIDATQTEIPVSWTDQFSEEGTGIFQIGTERIAFTGKTETSFTGCTRGYQAESGGDVASAHNALDGVLLIKSFPVESTAGFGSSDPDLTSGTFWIGRERIHYMSKTAGAFIGLTRGYVEDTGATTQKPTPAYPHHMGMLIRDGGDPTGSGCWSNLNPQPGSSVALHGVQTGTIDTQGLDDENALDLAAQRAVLSQGSLVTSGTAKLLDTSFRHALDVGDHMYLQEAEGDVANAYRLIKLHFVQADASIEITFGQPEINFFSSTARWDQAVYRAQARVPLSSMGQVTAVGANGETIAVQLPDGTTVWARSGGKTT